MYAFARRLVTIELYCVAMVVYSSYENGSCNHHALRNYLLSKCCWK